MLRPLTASYKESDVARILNLTKKSAERQKAWDGLVKQGDFNHNYTVLEKGKGVVIPKYRNVEGVNARRYIPCEHCKGFYSKNDLWRHQGWVEWGFYALSASKAIFRARTYNCNLVSPVMMIT